MPMNLKVPEWIFIYKDDSSSSSNSLVDNDKHHFSPAFTREYCDIHTRVRDEDEYHYYYENQWQSYDKINWKQDIQGHHLNYRNRLNKPHQHTHVTKKHGSYNYRQNHSGSCNYWQDHNLHHSSFSSIGDRFSCDNKRSWDTHDHRMYDNRISETSGEHRLQHQRDMKRPRWTKARKYESHKSQHNQCHRWNGRGYPPGIYRRFAK